MNLKVVMTIDDYIVLANIPTIQLESEEELPGMRRRNQSPSPCREQRLKTYRLVVPYGVWIAITDSPMTMHRVCIPSTCVSLNCSFGRFVKNSSVASIKKTLKISFHLSICNCLSYGQRKEECSSSLCRGMWQFSKKKKKDINCAFSEFMCLSDNSLHFNFISLKVPRWNRHLQFTARVRREGERPRERQRQTREMSGLWERTIVSKTVSCISSFTGTK